MNLGLTAVAHSIAGKQRRSDTVIMTATADIIQDSMVWDAARLQLQAQNL